MLLSSRARRLAGVWYLVQRMAVVRVLTGLAQERRVRFLPAQNSLTHSGRESGGTGGTLMPLNDGNPLRQVFRNEVFNIGDRWRL